MTTFTSVSTAERPTAPPAIWQDTGKPTGKIKPIQPYPDFIQFNELYKHFLFRKTFTETGEIYGDAVQKLQTDKT